MLETVMANKELSTRVVIPSDANTGDWVGWNFDLSKDKRILAVNTRRGGGGVGVVNIFLRDENGEYKFKQKIETVGAKTANLNYGYRIKFNDSSNLLFIGMFNLDESANSFAGAVEVYEKGVDDRFSLKQQVMANDQMGRQKFGSAFAISTDGTELIVGAYTDSRTFTNGGAVYYYKMQSGQFVFKQKFVTLDNRASALFGMEVVGNSDLSIIAVGTTPLGITNSTLDAIYIFKRQPNGTYTQSQKLSNPVGSSPQAWFGYSMVMSASGDMLIAPQPGCDAGGVRTVGRFHHYKLVSGTYSLIQTVVDPANDTGGRFAYTASLFNNESSLLIRGGAYLTTVYEKKNGVFGNPTKTSNVNVQFVQASTDGDMLLYGSISSTDYPTGSVTISQ